MMKTNLSYRAKFLVSVLFLSNVALAATGGYFYMTGVEEKKLRLSVESLADRLANELGSVHEKLGNAQLELEIAHRNLGQVADQNRLLQVGIAERDQRIEEMGRELARLRNEVSQVDLGQVLVTGGQKTLETLAAPIAMVTAPASKPEPEPAAVTLEGSILAVNQEFDFVIVSLGAEHEIRQGMTLSARRPQGPEGASLRVDMVDQTTCAATIIRPGSKPLTVGERVWARIS